MHNDDEDIYEKIQIKQNSFLKTIARSQHLSKKDIYSICFLTFLYFLQGVPLGLTGSVPFILSSRKVSYVNQGTFSFAFWPFSLKVLWAPVVDSIFSKRLGRRKSWLVPMQYLIGFFMFLTADYVNELLEGERPESSVHSDVFMLALIFFLFTFLAATQDVAVDGWGLTILSK
jgi:PAT family acetyl-CoA transporter-like MFS transporter 1